MAWLPLLIAAISYLADSGVSAFHERTDYRWFVGYGALNWVGFEMIRGFIPHHTGMAFFIVYDPVTKARDKSKR